MRGAGEFDLLDYLVLCLRAWPRTVVLLLLPALVAGILAWDPVHPPSAPPSNPALLEQARRDVDELTAVLLSLAPYDSIYWTAWERRNAAERRVIELTVSTLPATPRSWPAWWHSVIAAALAGLVIGVAWTLLDTWWRAKLTERPLSARREEIDAMTGRR